MRNMVVFKLSDAPEGKVNQERLPGVSCLKLDWECIYSTEKVWCNYLFARSRRETF